LEQWLGFDDLLSVTDVFLPNQTEALSITKSSDVETAAKVLGRKAKVVTIKLGANGALACQKDSIARSSSIPVDVVDTVGAGDSFDAGFLYGYLNGWTNEKSLRLACVCGALSTQQAGGTNGQTTLTEAMQYVSG
jgi:sugar/nucleoside kinase (ribokinase family)